MTELTLISSADRSIKPLVEAALFNEARLLEAGMRQILDRLRQFEQQYGTPTEEFVHQYANNKIEETLETIEWLGEYRMAQAIQEKLDTLREIRFAN